MLQCTPIARRLEFAVEGRAERWLEGAAAAADVATAPGSCARVCSSGLQPGGKDHTGVASAHAEKSASAVMSPDGWPTACAKLGGWAVARG